MKKILTMLTVAAMLAVGTNAAFEKVNTYENNFSDVKETSWYAENVKSAYELGFMNGKSEGQFDPNGNVTVAEGITMAARVNAIYNGKEITKKEAAPAEEAQEIRFDFDTDEGISLNHANGEVDGGILVMEPDAPNAAGHFDLGVFLNELDVDASVYKTLKVRMKREARENINERRENAEVYFTTETAATLGAEGTFLYPKLDSFNMDDWFELTVDLTQAPEWKGTVTRLRFDPTNNNGLYYIDYIVLTSASAKAPVVEQPKKEEKWYDMYVDYAVANGIIRKTTFGNYTRNATRAELASMFAAALPAEHFAEINDIKGIPDVDKKASYANALLMLYKAGVVLGDAEGNFNPDSDIKRSEVAAIINRVAIPESRVRGTVEAVWEEDAPKAEETPKTEETPKAEDAPAEESDPSPYDIEFESEDDLEIAVPTEVDEYEIVDGAVVIIPKDRGNERQPRFDPRIVMSDVAIDADKYKTLKVRVKAEFIGEVENGYRTDIYFMTEGDASFAEEKSAHPSLVEFSKLDEDGWYNFELDLSEVKNWNGTVTAFRFDPSNNNGIYSFDYIRFAE